MFKFAKKKVPVKMFKHAKSDYLKNLETLDESNYFVDQTAMANSGAQQTNVGTKTVEGSLDHLKTLTSYDRTKTNMEVCLKNAYIATTLKDNVFVSKEISNKIYNQVKEDPSVVEKYFEEEINHETGAVSHKMKLSKYQAFQTEEIASAMSKTKISQKDISDFNNQLIKFAKREMKSEETSSSAQEFLNFVLDYDDTYQVANNFAGPGSYLEQYSPYANVPVPVLALHAIASNGTIALNRNGSVNKVQFKKLMKNLEDDKLKNLVCDMCGLKMEGNKAVPLNYQEGSDEKIRADFFKSILPTTEKFFNQFSKDFQLSAIFTNEDYKQKISNLEEECERYLVDAVKSKYIPTSISGKVRAEAEQFVEDINKENVRLGKRKTVDYVVSKSQAKSIELGVKQLANSVNVEIVEETVKRYKNQTEEINKEVVNIVKELGLNEEELKLVSKLKLRSVKPAKIVDCLKEYSYDFEVIANNTALIAQKESSVKIKTALEVVAHSNLSEEEQQTLYNEILAKNQKEIDDLVEFNKNVIKLVESKENMRVWNYTMGQIKFEGLSTVQDVYNKRVKEIEHSKRSNLSNLKKELKDLNGDISEKTIELDKNYVNRSELYKQFYAEKFKEKLKSYLSSLDLGLSTGLPQKEIDKQIEISQKRIMATPVISKDNKTDIKLDSIEEVLVSEVYRIAKGDIKYRNKNKSTINLKNDLTVLKTTILDGYSNGEGAGFGIVNGIRNELEKEALTENSNLFQVEKNIYMLSEHIDAQKEARDKKQAEIDNYEENTKREIDKINATASVADSKIRRVELMSRYEQLLNIVLDSQMQLDADFMNANVPEGISPSKTKAFLKNREIHRNELTAMIEDNKKQLAEIEKLAVEKYNLQPIITNNKQGAPVVDFKLINDPRKAFANDNENKETAENNIDISAMDDVSMFADAVYRVGYINETLSNETSPERKMELADKLNLEQQYRTAENYFEASRNTLENLRDNDWNLITEIASRQPKAGTKEGNAFVDECVKYQMQQLDPNLTEEQVTEQKNNYTQMYQNVLDGAQKQQVEQTQQAEQEQQNPQPEATDVKPEDEKVVAKPKKKAKSVPMNYTVKGCELAIKSIDKLIAKLDKQIKQDKLKAKEQAELARKEKMSEIKNTVIAEEEKTAEVESAMTESSIMDNEIQIPGIDQLKGDNKVNDALLRKAYLNVVYNEMGSVVKGMNKEQTAALFKELDVSIDTESLKDKSPAEISAMLEEKGISIDKQQKAITIQLSTVKNAQPTEQGELVNAKGELVEDRLYERFEAGNPEKVSEQFNSTTSKKKQTFIIRNLVIYALGKNIIDAETVKRESKEIENILTSNNYEVTPENIDKLVTGELKKEDQPLIKGFQEKIKNKAKENVPEISNVKEQK